VINVASYKQGVGYGRWMHVDGWSEAVIEFYPLYPRVRIESLGERAAELERLTHAAWVS